MTFGRGLEAGGTCGASRGQPSRGSVAWAWPACRGTGEARRGPGRAGEQRGRGGRAGQGPEAGAALLGGDVTWPAF